MADPLIAHRIKTLLFRVVDIHNNIFTTAIRVANKKYQREHFIPEVWCRTVKFRRDFTTGNNQTNNPPCRRVLFGSGKTHNPGHQIVDRNGYGKGQSVRHLAGQGYWFQHPASSCIHKSGSDLQGMVNVRSPGDSPCNSPSSISKAPMRTLVFIFVLSI